MMDTTAELKRRALCRAPKDGSGFWIIDHVQPGRGLSSVTYAHHDVGGCRVHHRHYTPGPYDAQAYGADSLLATPESTYSVWTGLSFPMSDDYLLGIGEYDSPEEWPLERMRAVVTQAVGVIPEGATISVWSPDGEGEIYLEFADDGVEVALSFAERLAAQSHKCQGPVTSAEAA